MFANILSPRSQSFNSKHPHLFDKDRNCRQLSCQKATVKAHCLLPAHFQTLRQFICTNKNFNARFLMTCSSRPSGYKNTALKILKCRITGQACQRKKERKGKTERKKKKGAVKAVLPMLPVKCASHRACHAQVTDRPPAQRPVKNTFQTTEPDRERRPPHRCGRASTDQR